MAEKIWDILSSDRTMVITNRSLCYELGVIAADAQTMMDDFAKRRKEFKQKDEIDVIYSVNGVLDNDVTQDKEDISIAGGNRASSYQQRCLKLVFEKDLNDEKSKFKQCQSKVYSISLSQQGNPSGDESRSSEGKESTALTVKDKSVLISNQLSDLRRRLLNDNDKENFLSNRYGAIHLDASTKFQDISLSKTGNPPSPPSKVVTATSNLSNKVTVNQSTSDAKNAVSSESTTTSKEIKAADFFAVPASSNKKQLDLPVNDSKPQKSDHMDVEDQANSDDKSKKDSFFNPVKKSSTIESTTSESSESGTKQQQQQAKSKPSGKATITSMFGLQKKSTNDTQGSKSDTVQSNSSTKSDSQEKELEILTPANAKQDKKIVTIESTPISVHSASSSPDEKPKKETASRRSERTKPNEEIIITKKETKAIESEEEAESESEVEFGEDPASKSKKSKDKSKEGSKATSNERSSKKRASMSDSEDKSDDSDEELLLRNSSAKKQRSSRIIDDSNDIHVETESEKLEREEKERSKQEKKEQKRLEREEEKKRIEEDKRLRELEDAEMAKKKFLSALGTDKTSNTKKESEKSGPVKMKRVLMTQTKIDEDGFECTEDVWVEVPLDQDGEDDVEVVEQPKSKIQQASQSEEKNKKESDTQHTQAPPAKKPQKAATGESKQRGIQSFFNKG